MIKKILNWLDRLVDPLRPDDRLLKQGIKNVFSDESVRTDVIKWYDVKEIDKYSSHFFTVDFLVDYFGVAVTARVNGAGVWFLGDAFDRAYEDKPMEPQPTMFALLPKLN